MKVNPRYQILIHRLVTNLEPTATDERGYHVKGLEVEVPQPRVGLPLSARA